VVVAVRKEVSGSMIWLMLFLVVILTAIVQIGPVYLLSVLVNFLTSFISSGGSFLPLLAITIAYAICGTRFMILR
jgi:hypothetical protein